MTAALLSKASKALALGGTGLGAVAAYRYQNLKQQESLLPGNELWKFDTRKAPNDNNKKLIVIGGGVVGVTAAYKVSDYLGLCLPMFSLYPSRKGNRCFHLIIPSVGSLLPQAALRGHSVVLLETRSEPGKECSACAAGGMQRANPVVNRSTWVAVTKCIAPISRFVLGGPDEPYKFFHIDFWKTLTDPFFLRWSMTFTRTSFLPPADQTDRQRELLSFTNFAVQDMVEMMEDKRDPMAKKSGYNPNGSLSLSYDAPAAQKDTSATSSATKAAKAVTTDTMATSPKIHPSGGNTYEPSKQISGEDIVNNEPSIRHQEKQPTTAKYEYSAAAASSERFTEELAERCLKDPKLDVTFLYDTRVKAVTTDSTNENGKVRVTQLRTNRGFIDVPEEAQVLVAAGAWVPHIMALMDLYAPVYPLKGYAMSVSAKEALSAKKDLKPQDLPTRIVSDKYMFTSRLGDEIRITSIGEFSGWSTLPTPSTDAEFRQEAIRQFPQLEPFIKEAKTKCGHRPYVSDGILLLGRVDTFDNLLVSCGPGSNGWKLAMGSGEIVERLVSGQTEDDISDELGFDAHSFSPAGRVFKAPTFAKLCRARWNV